jgi:hypothetical protein
MWNIITKTNKQVKYDQKLGNNEQTDSNWRGGRKRVMGERRGWDKSRNVYKGRKDKDISSGCEGGLNVGGGVRVR